MYTFNTASFRLTTTPVNHHMCLVAGTLNGDSAAANQKRSCFRVSWKGKLTSRGVTYRVLWYSKPYTNQ